MIARYAGNVTLIDPGMTVIKLSLALLGYCYLRIVTHDLHNCYSLKNRIPHEWDVLVIIFAQINYICQLAVEYPPFRSGRVDAGRQGYDLVTS